LEGCRGVGEAKEHHCRLKEAFTCLEGCFLFIAFLDSDVVVTPTDVKLGVPFLARQIMNEVGDQGKGIFIWHSPFVKVVIVLHQSISSILLFDEEKATGIWRLGSSDSLQMQVGIDELALLFFLHW
jgi:hypothetical protein